MAQVLRDGVERVMIAITAGKNDNAEFHREIKLLGYSGNGSNGGSLFARGSTLFGWRLTVALFQVRDDDGQYELLFAMLVELDDNVLFGAGNNGTKTEFGVFNLGSLREGWFKCHCGGIPLLLERTVARLVESPACSFDCSKRSSATPPRET